MGYAYLMRALAPKGDSPKGGGVPSRVLGGQYLPTDGMTYHCGLRGEGEPPGRGVGWVNGPPHPVQGKG